MREEPGADVAALYEKYSRALSIGGSLAEACVYLERSVDAYGAPLAIARSLRLCGGRGAVAFDALVTLAHFAALHGRLEEADTQLLGAELLPGRPPPSQRRDFHMVRALVRAMTARLGLAFEDYERAVTIARDAGDLEQLTWALSNYASRALASGYTERALAAYRESLQLLPIDEFGKVGMLANQGLASAYLMSGEIDAARAAHERGRQMISAMVLTQTAQIAMDIRLAYLADEELPPDRGAIDDVVAVAFESGETQNIGLLSGTLAADLDSTARTSEAQALRTRAIAAISSADLSLLLIGQLAAGESRALGCARAPRALRRARCPAATAVRPREVDRLAGRRTIRSYRLAVGARRRARGRGASRASAGDSPATRISSPAPRVGFRSAACAPPRRPRPPHAARDGGRATGGLSNREIAARLFIGERTVETHIAAIFDRFDLTSRRQFAELVAAQPR
ncbi:MAG: helix-turn-helix transcriptional regulator [Candidatus Cybelea sp.]